MNYAKIYDQLVEKCKPRGLDKSSVDYYTEIHHIVPRCIGGSNAPDNLVMFTGREHFLAHMLLWKIYPEDNNLFHAAWMMSNRSFINHRGRVYEALKKQHAVILSSRSEFNSPNFKDLTGTVNHYLTVLGFDSWTEQAKGKRGSVWKCVCKCGKELTLSGKVLSGKNAYKSCGCWTSERSSLNIGEINPFFGKKHSEESKTIMRQKKLGRSPSNKGVPMSEERRLRVKDALAKLDRFAYKHPSLERNQTSKLLWANADYLHNIYLNHKDITPAKFATLYNKLHCDSIRPCALVTILENFNKGWIPQEDEDWKTFKEESLGYD